MINEDAASMSVDTPFMEPETGIRTFRCDRRCRYPARIREKASS